MLVLASGVAVAIARSGTAAVTRVLMMGRTDTENTASLSNRAPLWSELLDNVEQHPVLGFGFEAFWSAERVQKISVDQGWIVPHAHNTYLDQTLSLGLVGAFLYTCTVVSGCVVAWRRYGAHSDESSLLPALLLSWLVLLSLSESIPIAPNLPTLIAYTCLRQGAPLSRERSDGANDLFEAAEILPMRTGARRTWSSLMSARQGAAL